MSAPTGPRIYTNAQMMSLIGDAIRIGFHAAADGYGVQHPGRAEHVERVVEKYFSGLRLDVLEDAALAEEADRDDVPGEVLLVCGSRTWTDRERLFKQLDDLHAAMPIARVIHGGARGADALAGEWAAARGIDVKVFDADWDKHGKAAGPIRNLRMVEHGRPTQAVAFAVDLPNSKGTRDMLSRLNGVPTLIVNEPAP